PGPIDSGWVVVFPTGSSDFFSVSFTVNALKDDERDTVTRLMPIKAVGVNVADFGTSLTYPVVGAFNPNTGLDPLGNTPNLSSPITTSSESYAGGGAPFIYQSFDAPEGTIPAANATALTVVQLPPGDSGLLAVGADSNVSPNVQRSGFTQDGYATTAVTMTFLDFGMPVGQDNTTTTSCKPADRLPHGR